MVAYDASFDELAEIYARLGIGCDVPGFYDHPRFVEAERHDVIFLNSYARYVQTRIYSQAYRSRAEEVIRTSANILHERLKKDGRLGACIDASMVLSRILEREGVWNFIVKGALTVTFPTSNPDDTLYFWPIDNESEASAAHVWLYAPPFVVVDVTVARQPFDHHLRPYLNRVVFATDSRGAPITVEDICSPGARQEAERQGFVGEGVIYAYNPELKRFFRVFQATALSIDDVRLKYVPCAIGAPVEPLEGIRSLELCGLSGLQIYEEEIVPQLRGAS